MGDEMKVIVVGGGAAGMMAAIAAAIVREKEVGTMEVLLVSPVRPSYVIFKKQL